MYKFGTIRLLTPHTLGSLCTSKIIFSKLINTSYYKSENVRSGWGMVVAIKRIKENYDYWIQPVKYHNKYYDCAGFDTCCLLKSYLNFYCINFKNFIITFSLERLELMDMKNTASLWYYFSYFYRAENWENFYCSLSHTWLVEINTNRGNKVLLPSDIIIWHH